jgi:hypothetical protein
MIALMAKAVGGPYCPIKAGLRLSMNAFTASERLAVACVDPIRSDRCALSFYGIWPLDSSGGSERRAAGRSAFVPSTTRSRVERYENSAQVHHVMQHNAVLHFIL